MKVVINKCYGGFSLSHQGVMEYAKLKGIQLYPYVNGHGPNYRKMTPYTGQKDAFVIHYLTQPLTAGEAVTNEHYFSDHNIERNDPLLVQVVETLGDAANGSCAKLAIVEIPDDVAWEIDEYDGMESIDEKHRTWY